MKLGIVHFLPLICVGIQGSAAYLNVDFDHLVSFNAQLVEQDEFPTFVTREHLKFTLQVVYNGASAV